MSQDTLDLLNSTIFQYGQRRLAKAKHENRRFVHYTSAPAAISIIEKQEIWLRSSGVMNDYSEITHGHLCLEYVLKGDNEVRERCERALGHIHPNAFRNSIEFLETTANYRMVNTYLLAISEHGAPDILPGHIEDEDEYGRLSMWRAYGCGNGVALIFNGSPIFQESQALGVYSSPVFYGTPNWYSVEFCKVLRQLEDNADQLKKIPPEVFQENFNRFIHFSSLATKHPGFSEEREWRVTFSANPANEPSLDDEFNAANPIKREFRDVAGIPQRIYKIPFKDQPDKGLVGMNISAILERVIIGPTQYAVAQWDAVVAALQRAGVHNAHERVKISGVPLRT